MMINTDDLPQFQQANVLVFGDLMLDRYLGGESRRISPEAPVPIVKVSESNTRPGGAANVALNIAAIQGQVSLFGVVGKDQEATDLKAQLTAKHVNCHFHYLPTGSTICKLRVIAHSQQMIRLDFESSLHKYDDTELMEIYQKQLAQTQVVILSDYGKGTLKNSAGLIELAREKKIPVIVDPKGNDYSIYAGASVITPNLREFEAVVGPCGQDEDLIVTKARALMLAHDLEAILVTRGKDGMTLVSRNEKNAVHLSAEAREVYDVTGAGDTVVAFIGAALAVGVTLEKAAYIANVAAGLVVRKLGTAFITLSELRSELRNKLGVANGIVSENELLSIVRDSKARGEKIVMTNGCFDILHPGHIGYLNEARKLGDRLIVAVNTDESVARLGKGVGRPFNTLNARMEVLAGLRAVDWVVPFKEDTPLRIISHIMPDVLVKGGDYTVKEVVGHDIVQQNGGEVVILPFRVGYSTTRLVEKVRGD